MSDELFATISKKAASEPYARKLGIRLLKLDSGYSLVEMRITEEMANIFGLTHGGVIFSLADEAFEIASNSHGIVTLALNMSISYLAPPSIGDTLRAEAKEVNRSSRISNYNIEVKTAQGKLIAVCQAIAFRKNDRL